MSLRYPRKPYQRSDDIESFIHAYIYLVLRYHETSVGSLKTKVETLFEGVSLVGGIKIGGDEKLYMLRVGHLGFEITDNMCLQQLLGDILEECKATYAAIDYPEMQRLYGPAKTTAQSGRPVTQHDPPQKAVSSILRASDYGARSTAAMDPVGGLRSRLKRPRRVAESQPAAPADPCKIGPFLSDSLGLMELLAEHYEEAYGLQDKACDQFVARKVEDVFRPSERDACRSIGAMSVTGSYVSEDAPVDVPIAVDESDMFTVAVKSSADLVRERYSYDSPASTSSKKRTYSDEAEQKQGIADDGEERSDGRRTKRAKGRKGKAASYR